MPDELNEKLNKGKLELGIIEERLRIIREIHEAFRRGEIDFKDKESLIKLNEIITLQN